MRAFLVRLCKHYDVADDLAQETFITAYRKLGSFQGAGTFSGWLFRIAYHCFLQQQRHHKRCVEIGEQYTAHCEVLTDHYESISAEQIDLERAMQTLSDDEVATISLCHSYGYSHQEVADILAIPLGTVKTHILRGKGKLQALLSGIQSLEKAS